MVQTQMHVSVPGQAYLQVLHLTCCLRVQSRALECPYCLPGAEKGWFFTPLWAVHMVSLCGRILFEIGQHLNRKLS